MPETRSLPKWAAALDLLAIALALVALAVITGGGFRWMTFGVRISVTDWWRPAIGCAAALAIRHWFVRQHPLPARIWRAMVALWRSKDLRAVLPVHLATRGGVLAVGFLAILLIGIPQDATARWRLYRNEFLNLPARWDAGWYLSIANEGYTWDRSLAESQQNIAFFPALPLIVRYLSEVLGNQPLWTATVLSMLSFLGALVYLLRLARQDLKDEGAALTAVTLLAVYPFSVFYSAAYTEGLFLVAVVGAIYHFRRDELLRAMLWGFLAGLTRPPGCFLSIVLALYTAETIWRERRLPETRKALVTYADRLAAAAAPGLGMLAYSTYVYFLTGSPFQWAAQNIGWGRVYRSIDTVFTDRVAYMYRAGVYGYISELPTDFMYAVAVLFVFASLWGVYRRFGLPYTAFLLLNTLPPMAAGGLLSMGRVTSVLFPAFLWMAAVVPERHRAAWIAVFACLQGFVAVMFFTWRPLY